MIRKLALIAGIGAVLLSAIFIMAGCGGLPDNAAAKVNNVIITRDDVADRIRVIKGLEPSQVPSDPSSDAYKQFQSGVAQELVAEEMQRQEAEKRGITVSDDEIQNALNQVVQDKYLGDINKMQDDFTKRGITVDDLRAQLKRQLEYQKLLKQIKDEVPVTDQEVQDAYNAAKSTFVHPEKRQVRQIVLPDQASAQSVFQRVQSGEDFATLAKELSIDNATKANSGLVGLVSQSSLPPAVATVAFSLPNNGVSQPFKGDLGWYVVKVELITPAVNQTFDQVKDQLAANLANQHLQAHWKDFQQSLKDNYTVEYADDYSYTSTGLPVGTAPDASSTSPGSGQ